MSDLVIGIVIGSIIGFVITFSVAYYFNKKQDENFELLFSKMIEKGKEEHVVFKQPRPQPQQKSEYFHVPDNSKHSYDLSTGTTANVGEGKMVQTTDPVIKEIFDYGTTQLGKKVVDHILDSIFSEDEEEYEPNFDS